MSTIDYSTVATGQQEIAELAGTVSLADPKAATDEHTDEMLNLIRGLSDVEVTAVASVTRAA